MRPPDVVPWAEFERLRPDLAGPGRNLLYAFGVGLGFLSTVRSDGGPRLHPICPMISPEGLFAFLIRSPKAGDLRRDPRYALHSFPMDHNEDAFYLTGIAEEVGDAAVRGRLERRYAEERPHVEGLDLSDQALFSFGIGTVMLTTTTGHGDADPVHVVWRA